MHHRDTHQSASTSAGLRQELGSLDSFSFMKLKGHVTIKPRLHSPSEIFIPDVLTERLGPGENILSM